MRRYVLDTCALIALFQNEEGADRVAAAINAAKDGKAEVIIHKANLLEAYYDAYRSRGKNDADLMLAKFKKLPIKINPEITDEIFFEAGRLKATYKISFADSFALAQTKASNGELLTSDHHEFDAIDKEEQIKFSWIR